jgi:RimJ/RimL family protein N-acetyltransferase
MHQARSFGRGHYGEVVIYSDNVLVHHTGFAARYWRFPFLRKDDLQIATSWTSPAHRDQELAEFAVEKIIGAYRRPGRCFWYCVEDDNPESIRVAEKTGFSLVEIGEWVVPLGVELLSYYRILDPARAQADTPMTKPIAAASSATARV